MHVKANNPEWFNGVKLLHALLGIGLFADFRVFTVAKLSPVGAAL